MTKKLTDEFGININQKAFADNWLADPGHSGRQAYLKAYPTCKTNTGADVNAGHLLRHPKVSAYIKFRQKKLAKIAEASQERVILEERRLAFCDVRQIVDGAGVRIPPHELPEDVARAISGIDIIEKPTIFGVETTYKYRFWSKNKALDALSKHLGLYEKDNQQRGVSFEQLIGVLNSLDPAFADRVCAKLAESLSD